MVLQPSRRSFLWPPCAAGVGAAPFGKFLCSYSLAGLSLSPAGVTFDIERTLILHYPPMVLPHFLQAIIAAFGGVGEPVFYASNVPFRVRCRPGGVFVEGPGEPLAAQWVVLASCCEN